MGPFETLARFAQAAQGPPATFSRALDSPPLPPPIVDSHVYAAGDIFPLGAREEELCARASHPDWVYLGALVALDAAALWFGSSDTVKYASSVPLRLSGPALVGVTWGATVGGAWLSLPKCSPHWIGPSVREGTASATWPLAISLALLAGATAPVINGIAIGSNLPLEWTTLERESHLVVAGLAGFAGALLPYAIPPRTWSAAQELNRIRLGASARGAFVSYTAAF
jgi:hypothetical protein